MCYCIENSGIAAFKPSNILYLYHALHHLKGFNFTLQWRKLEVLTNVLLGSGTKLTVEGKSGSIILPAVSKRVIQQQIGDLLPGPHVGVVLYEMANGHNVIDSIIYDMRSTRNASIYFIQVSSTQYSKKTKKEECLRVDKVMDGPRVCSTVPISSHYTVVLPSVVHFKNLFYIYVTVPGKRDHLGPLG